MLVPKGETGADIAEEEGEQEIEGWQLLIVPALAFWGVGKIALTVQAWSMSETFSATIFTHFFPVVLPQLEAVCLTVKWHESILRLFSPMDL